MTESPAGAAERPSTAPEEQIGFTDGGAVDVREIDEKRWLVLTPFSYQASRERFTVPEGERTDFASVPRPFVWFIPTYGRYTWGKLEIMALRERARKEWGPAFSLRRFHAAMLDLGSPPLGLLGSAVQRG